MDLTILTSTEGPDLPNKNGSDRKTRVHDIYVIDTDGELVSCVSVPRPALRGVAEAMQTVLIDLGHKVTLEYRHTPSSVAKAAK